MKVLVHDLTDQEIKQLSIKQEDYYIIPANIKAAHCQGCFGCWGKSAGKCVYKDQLQYVSAVFAQCEEIIVISKNCYGCYSAGVKKIFDRCVADSVFLFTYRGKRMHHVGRYRNRPKFTVYMYGEMSDFEKQIASEFIKANGVNFNYQSVKSFFVKDYTMLRGEL